MSSKAIVCYLCSPYANMNAINNFVFIYKIIRFLIHFKNFPNPHLRTSAFYITARDFINFMKGKKVSSKFDAVNNVLKIN